MLTGYPSYYAGMKVHDFLVSVNGQEIFAMNHAQVVSLIKNSGDSISLAVERWVKCEFSKKKNLNLKNCEFSKNIPKWIFKKMNFQKNMSFAFRYQNCTNRFSYFKRFLENQQLFYSLKIRFKCKFFVWSSSLPVFSPPLQQQPLSPLKPLFAAWIESVNSMYSYLESVSFVFLLEVTL